MSSARSARIWRVAYGNQRAGNSQRPVRKREAAPPKVYTRDIFQIAGFAILGGSRGAGNFDPLTFFRGSVSNSESRRAMEPPRPKVLAVSSGGGHWVQLMRLRPAFADCDVLYASVWEGYRSDVAGARFCAFPDANRTTKIALIRCFTEVARLIFRERPDVIITTGAAPGYFAVRIGKLVGARTVWIDSVANAEELSLSGNRVGKHVDLWLTQWPHLATAGGPQFRGSVL